MHTRHTHFRWNHEARLCNFSGPDTPKPVDQPPAIEAKKEAQVTISPTATETPQDTQKAAADAAKDRGGMQPANQQQIEEAAARNKAAREAAVVAPTLSPALAPASAPSEPVAPPAAPTSATTPEASTTPASASSNVPEGYRPIYSQVNAGEIDDYHTPDGNVLIPDADGNFNFPSTAPDTAADTQKPAAQLQLPDGVPQETAAKIQEIYATMSSTKQAAFNELIRVKATGPDDYLIGATCINKMPDSTLVNLLQNKPQQNSDYKQLSDVVLSLTKEEFDFFSSTALSPALSVDIKNPLRKEAQTPQGMKNLLDALASGSLKLDAPGLSTVPESGDPNADRVNKAVDDLKSSLNGKDMGKFLTALAEVFASIKAIFKPEAAKDQGPQGPGQPPEAGGNTPPNSPDGSPDATGSPPEAGGEKQSEKRDRVRKEVQEAGSIDQFKKDKEASRDAKMGEYDNKIDAEQAENQALDDTNDGLKKQVTDAEQKLSNPKTKPEEKADLEKQIRDLNVTIKANDEHTENNRKDIKEMTDKRNKLYTDTEGDIKEVDAMIKEAKDKVQSITKTLEALSKDPAAKNIEGADKILAGVTITVDENKLDVVITITDEAKQALTALADKAGVSVKDILDKANGKPEDATNAAPDKNLDMAKVQPAVD